MGESTFAYLLPSIHYGFRLRSFNLEWRVVYGKVSRYVQTVPTVVKQIVWSFPPLSLHNLTNRSAGFFFGTLVALVRPHYLKSIGSTWVGFFPFVFWGSFWIAGLYKNERVARSTSAAQTSALGLDEEATRAASSALAWYAGTSLVFAIGLPFAISNQDHRASRFIGYRFDLVAAWALGQLIFALCMFSTWWVTILYDERLT